MGKSVAIITARGGSKRIPRKNIKHFLGEPIIKYSIVAAIESNFFDEIMVSTDDPEIAEVALSYNAKVPFLRSVKNSDDYSTTCDVLEEVIMTYKGQGKIFEYLCCIYPTAPFITSNKLRSSMQILLDSDADCVLPIVGYSYPIQRSLKVENGKAVMNWPENYLSRSQDLMPIYHDCGQYYCMRVQSLLEQKKLFAKNTIPVLTSELEVQDIDNLVDWELAELKYQFLKKHGKI